MDFTFWFMEGLKGSGKKPVIHNNKARNYKTNAQATKKKIELIIVSRLKALLLKYQDDAETTDKILGEFNMYRANLTIARDFKDKQTENELTNKFIKFLNQF